MRKHSSSTKLWFEIVGIIAGLILGGAVVLGVSDDDDDDRDDTETSQYDDDFEDD